MKSMPILILDVSHLAYRALYTTGDLSHEGVKTGVVFGLFRDIAHLSELLQSTRFVWAFDYGYGKRAALSRTYKQNRRKEQEDPEKREAREVLREQIRWMRDELLPELGYQNVFYQEGYEADDVIARVCLDLPEGEQAIIVSRDEDLYQLLSHGRVTIWDSYKSRELDEDWFRRTYGIGVGQWRDVKALAGCSWWIS